MTTFVEGGLVDAFGFAEVVLVVPALQPTYFLPGMRSLFFRSGYLKVYTASEASFGNYTRGFVTGGNVSSSRFPA